MAEMTASRPMDWRRVLRAVCLWVAALWPVTAALLAHTDVSALWGGGKIGVEPDGFYAVFLTAYSMSLLLFAESVRRRSWPGICWSAVCLLFWAVAGLTEAILPG
jgi:hypothetical protein